jgi:hypothetical protein
LSIYVIQKATELLRQLTVVRSWTPESFRQRLDCWHGKITARDALAVMAAEPVRVPVSVDYVRAPCPIL